MIQSLQKCSDREAKIYFSQSWQDVRKIKDLENQGLKTSKAYGLGRGLLKNTSSYNRFELRDETSGLKSGSKEKIQFQSGSMMSESRVKAYNNLPTRFTATNNNLQVKQRTTSKPNVSYSNYTNESNQRRQNALKS